MFDKENDQEEEMYDNRGLLTRAFDWCCDNPAVVVIGGIAVAALLKVNKLQKVAMVQGQPYQVNINYLPDESGGSMTVTPIK